LRTSVTALRAEGPVLGSVIGGAGWPRGQFVVDFHFVLVQQHMVCDIGHGLCLLALAHQAVKTCQ